MIGGIDDFEPVDLRTPTELAVEAVLLVPNVVKLLARLMGDSRVPIRRRALAGAVFGYVVSPINVVPGFVIGVGVLGDIVAVSVAADHLMSGVESDIVREHWGGSQDALDLVRSAFAWAGSIVPGRPDGAAVV